MAVPNMARTLRGWIKSTTVKTVVQTVVDYETVNTETETTLKINKQPLPSEKVVMLPGYDRAWKWWSLIIQSGPLLSIDDIIEISGIGYKIKEVVNWSESGFQKYKAIESYTVET